MPDERTSTGMDETCRLRRGEGYGGCEDVIDMKSLERAVAREAKGGYTLAVSGTAWYFLGDSWMAYTTLDALRGRGREVLGAVVEQLGELPEGGAVKIRKSGGEFVVQDEMWETVTAAMDSFVGATQEELRAAGLWYGGRWLMQAENGLLYGTPEGGPAWSGSEPRTLTEKMCMAVSDGREALYKRLKRPDDGWNEDIAERWHWLEGRMWVDWEATR